MDIIVVEDNDRYFQSMQEGFSEANLTSPVIRATHWRQAMLLAMQHEGRAFWIVDGMFPMYENETHLRKLWPDVIYRIHRRRGGDETIVGFSSEPEIFENMEERYRPKIILSKDRLESSVATIVRYILAESAKG